MSGIIDHGSKWPHWLLSLSRDRRGWLQDVRWAVRALLASPLYSAVALLTLAITIGANTLVFSAVNSLFLRPVGVMEPSAIVAIRAMNGTLGMPSLPASATDYADISKGSDVFATTAMGAQADVTYGAGEFPERLSSQRVTWQWFEVFGVQPLLGRVFSAVEDRPGARGVVVLEYATWQRLFGGDRSVVGKTIQLSEEPYEVIGVMPPRFKGVNLAPGARVNIWRPMRLPEAVYGRENRFNNAQFTILGRLRPGASFEQAQAFASLVSDRVRQSTDSGNTAENLGWGLFAVRYVDFVVGDLKTPMLMLMGAVIVVLLIACINVAWLEIARTSAHMRELAIRVALGASRWRLVRQRLIETLALALGGSLLGLAVAVLAMRVLVTFAPPSLEDYVNGRPDPRLVLFSLAVGLIAGVLAGVVPAWRIPKNIQGRLKEGGPTGTTPPHRYLRGALMTSEVALALALTIGAVLLVQSLVRLQRVDIGFVSNGVVTGSVALPFPRYREPERRAAFYRTAVEQLSNEPGITEAAVAFPVPFGGIFSGEFRIESAVTGAGPAPQACVQWVSPGYFAALGVPLRSGRTFSESDTIGAAPVVVVDEALARQHWSGGDPLGRRVRREPSATWSTIVGVVGRVKNFELATDFCTGMYYVPIFQAGGGFAADLVLKTDLDAQQAFAAMRRAVHTADSTQPVFNVQVLDDRILQSLGHRPLTVSLLVSFAAMAIVLAMLGVYGVVNYMTTQRTNEIGARMAMGATARNILLMMLREVGVFAAIGLAAGIGLAVAFSRTITALLFGITSLDALSFAVASMGLAIVTLAAAYLPARRAGRLDPLIALRARQD
jgi:predicted permease